MDPNQPQTVKTQVKQNKMKSLKIQNQNQLQRESFFDVQLEERKLSQKDYFENRSNKIREMKSSKNVPYPHKFEVSISIENLIKNHKSQVLQKQEKMFKVSISGRITTITRKQTVLIFDIRGGRDNIKVVFEKIQNTEIFNSYNSIFRRGDVIGVTGTVLKDQQAGLFVEAMTITMLCPCLHKLPPVYGGISDQLRYRKRYLDLIVNAKSRDTFFTRARIIQFIRKYLTNLEFLEVETPMLNVVPGGAIARPFSTHHSDLNSDFYLRVSPQIFLKECVVGGLERVFEIGRNFRNQIMDQVHNPQYTSCEFYMAYSDYFDLIKLTEDMISSLVKEITGGLKIKYQPEGTNDPYKFVQIDFTPPWKRLSMMEEIAKIFKAEIPKDLESQQARQFFSHHCKKHNIECQSPRTTLRMLDKINWHLLESQCLNPTFIIQHPQFISPLAKNHRSKPGLTERFQLYIHYHEYCNAYTQLNDPEIQTQLFLSQLKQRQNGNVQAMFCDEVFVNALEYGLPPTAGWGIGIDRLVMLLTNHIKIQEVLLFPTLNPNIIPNKQENYD